MLTIRREQMEEFERVAFEGFLKRLAEHLLSVFPNEFGSPPLADPLEFARRSAERAQRHELASEDDLRRYAEVAAILGPNFDEDPQHEWAGEIMRETDTFTPGERIALIWDAVSRSQGGGK